MENNTNIIATNGNVTADEIAAMQSQISELTAKLTAVNATVDRLNVRLEEVRVQRDHAEGDFRTLNGYLNTYADEKGLCGEYEKQLDEWNGGFTCMKLEGRIREYQIEFEVSFRYTATVSVEASSEEDAREQAENMSPLEIMESNEWDYPDYEDASINGIELA